MSGASGIYLRPTQQGRVFPHQGIPFSLVRPLNIGLKTVDSSTYIAAPPVSRDNIPLSPPNPGGKVGGSSGSGDESSADQRKIRKTWEELKNLLIEHKVKPESMKRIENAYMFARKAHKGQRREAGEPYLCHSLRAAKYVIEQFGFENTDEDEATTIATILHDVLEDTDVTRIELESNFGLDVLKLVDGVTKYRKTDFSSRAIRKEKSLEKLILELLEDPRIGKIKFGGDRRDNMETLDKLQDTDKESKEDRQQRIAQETSDIDAKFAEYLGWWGVKEKLEDLAFKYIRGKEEYEQLSYIMEEGRKKREKLAEQLVEEIKAHLIAYGFKESDIKMRIKWRTNLNFIIESKRRPEPGPLFDVEHIVVVLPTIKDCYYAPYPIHRNFRPLPGEFKDYITNPKGFFQSITTKVICKIGFGEEIMEIMFRTEEMEELAKFGILAKRKELEKKPDPEWERGWEEEMLNLKKMILRSRSLYKDLKGRMQSIFVYTSKLEQLFLPQGSTAHDFAYEIHSGLGNEAKEATVDGFVVPLDTKLRTGQKVEIIKGGTPDRRQVWRTISPANVKAWEAIRRHFAKSGRDKNIEEGRGHLVEVFNEKLHLDYRNKSVQWLIIESSKGRFIKKVDNLIKGRKIENIEDMEYAVGICAISPEEIADEFKQYMDSFFRRMKKYEVELSLKITDRMGLAKDVTEALENLGINIEEVRMGTKEDKQTPNYLRFYVKNNVEVMQVMNALSEIKGVKKIERISRSPKPPTTKKHPVERK